MKQDGGAVKNSTDPEWQQKRENLSKQAAELEKQRASITEEQKNAEAKWVTSMFEPIHRKSAEGHFLRPLRSRPVR